MLHTINKFKIGADPEFYALKKGVHFNVRQYTTKECPTVGWDHRGDILEVKPEPSKSSMRLVRRMRKLLFEDPVSKAIIREGCTFRSGAYVRTENRTVTLGGHVHIDKPFASAEVYRLQPGENCPSACSLPENKPIVEALDAYTKKLEDEGVLPRDEAIYRRRYGQADAAAFGSVRCGNASNHLEYRAMCSWLHSPVAALLALTGAKVLATHPDSLKGQTLVKFFEQFKGQDVDVDRVLEKVFEHKLPIEAKLDVDLQDSWRSLQKLGVERV